MDILVHTKELKWLLPDIFTYLKIYHDAFASGSLFQASIEKTCIPTGFDTATS